MAKDFLLDNDGDLAIENNDLVIGESLTQEVELVMQTNQGEWKRSPLLGPNLIEKINSGASPREIKQAVKLSLEMDGKDYNELKDYLNVKVNE